MALLHEDRLFPAEEKTRAIARRLYDGIKDLPIVSPHGHTQAGWFARNEPFPDVGSSRVDLQACKLEYSIVSPK